MAESPSQPAANLLLDEQFIRELTVVQNNMYAYILTLLPDHHSACDVLQETNIELCRRATTFQLGTNFLAWGCRVAQYKVLEHRRRTKRELLVFADELLPELAIAAEQQATRCGDESAALDDCLAELPPRQRELIASRYAPDGSVEQIAKQRACSPGSISVTLFRIRRALLECIERKLAAREVR